MNAPITLADVRALITGDGFSDTRGVGLAMALDAMTSAALSLLVAYEALSSDASAEDVQSMIFRVSVQLKNTAGICWRVAGTEEIMRTAAEPEEGEAAP